MSSPVETKRIRDHLQIEEGGGAALPEVTADDNGDVLTVVEGAWAKAAAPSGGGVMIVSVTEVEITWTLGNTWQEIHDAFVSGVKVLIAFPVYHDGDVHYEAVNSVRSDSGQHDVTVLTGGGEYTFHTSDPDGYPDIYFD